MLDKQKCGLSKFSLLQLLHTPFGGMFLETIHHPSIYHVSQSLFKRYDYLERRLGNTNFGLGTFLLLINSKACYLERRTWIFALQYIHFSEKVTKYLSLEVLLTCKMNKIGNADARFRKVKIFLVN